MSSSDRLCECIKLNRNRSIEYFAESSSVIETFHGNEQLTEKDPDIARRCFFPAISKSVEHQKKKRPTKEERLSSPTPFTFNANGWCARRGSTARRHHSSQTQTVVEAAKNRDGCISVYIGPPSERTNLSTYANTM